ncbi:NAD-dependent epimerase/dehydratase family protein [Methylococcus sp. ANG]|uniref:NAD-dependent epimerase/dehydratase family protein n=1 Tax=Methylococcus sp. ANG TaxID=3231903 RepID=UPI00345A6157
MKVLITGATGFLGSHLVRAWVPAGHTVAILERRGLHVRSSGGEGVKVFSFWGQVCG